MFEWIKCHECVRRALRTFLQTAAGVVAAALIDAAGIAADVDLKALIVLAVATGLSAAMNAGTNAHEHNEEQEDDQ